MPIDSYVHYGITPLGIRACVSDKVPTREDPEGRGCDDARLGCVCYYYYYYYYHATRWTFGTPARDTRVDRQPGP
jgi:hypothetical protein